MNGDRPEPEQSQRPASWQDRVNDAYYDRMGAAMGERTRARIHWMCAQCRGSTVLDVGCSQGIASILLAREGFQVHGIDIAQDAVDQADQIAQDENPEIRQRLRFQCIDLLSLSTGSFDNVLIGEVIEHHAQPRLVIEAAVRRLAPGGRLILTTPFGLHPFPDHKATIFPRPLAEWVVRHLPIAAIEVVDGYIRLIAGHGDDSVDRQSLEQRLLEITEAGAEQAQQRLHLALAEQRESASANADTGRRLSQISARAEKLEDVLRVRDSDAATVSEQHQQLTRQLGDVADALCSDRQSAAGELKNILASLKEIGERVAQLTDTDDALRQQITTLQLQAEQQFTVLDDQVRQNLTGKQDIDQLKADIQAADQRNQEAIERLVEIDRLLLTETDRIRRDRDDLIAQSGAQHARLTSLQAELDQARHQLRESQSRLEQSQGQLSTLEDKCRTLSDRLEITEAAARAGHHLQSSIALQLGNLLLSSARSPRALMRLPAGLTALLREARRRRRTDPDDPHFEPRIVTRVDLPWEWTRDIQMLDAATPPPVVTPAPGPAPTPPKVTPSDTGTGAKTSLPERPSDLRIATIMDEFSAACFGPECHLLQLLPDDWQSELASFQPHLLMVESAWRGKDGRWANAITQTNQELQRLVRWCRDHGIPTVFWNKEDPVHFRLFLRSARLFDVVFTTDSDRLGDYRRELGHDRVHLLPFAVQPREHNPIERYRREPGFCFAGSYYHKYPERKRDFENIVRVLQPLGGIDIYDRNHGSDEPSLAFPDEYQPLVRGRLPVERIDKAYKGYRGAINLNTVKQSQSMFARRLFELLASNTLTISNYSRGMRILLGDLVVNSDNPDQLLATLSPLLDDETRNAKHRLAGLRKVLREHTCEERLRRIVEATHGHRYSAQDPLIIIPVRVTGTDDITLAREMLARQTHARLRLVLVFDRGLGLSSRFEPSEQIEVRTLREASALVIAEQWPDAYIAGYHAQDYHAPNYFTDLALATRYTDASVLGRNGYYRRTPEGEIRLFHPDKTYCDRQSIPPRRAMVKTTELGPATLTDWLSGALDETVAALPAVSIDAFNFCENAGAGDVAQVEDLTGIDHGISYRDLDRLSQNANPPAIAAPRVTGFRQPRCFRQQALASLFKAARHANGKLQLAHGAHGIDLVSTLAEDEHAYVYASRLFPLEELTDDDHFRFHLEAGAGLIVTVAVVFFDAGKQRLGHAIVSSSTNQTIPVPAQTSHARIGLRVLGPGSSTVVQLALGHLPVSVPAVVGRGDLLLVARDYPRYDNLYRYAFLHSRTRAYATAGHRPDVFRFSRLPLQFDEFQGIDVTAGQSEHLALLIRSNRYRAIAAHVLDRQMWEALKPVLATTPVTVFVHGIEAQRWFRRGFNYPTDPERDGAIQHSRERMTLWKEILSDLHPNLRLVFVSRHLARTVLNDVGIDIPESRYEIIHNYIDGDLFPYRPRNEAHRLKVLSIRPFASPVYANDLTVKAILDLAGEPWFGQMEFHIVGNGPLFDETVEPLRHLPNVILQQQFLTQAEIAALHADYGIFLCPSRMDSQGVSRDEAMASGLVPVTSRIAAIPEFTDDSCAILAAPEDWRGLADGIRRLVEDPNLFLDMSAAAARRVRNQSGHEQTIQRELTVIGANPRADDPGQGHSRGPTDSAPRYRIAVYGDVNLNIMDGSAVWAASIVQALASFDDCRIDLYLKAQVRKTDLLDPLMMLDNVRVIEPDTAALTPEQALTAIAARDGHHHYHAVILRGAELCRLSSQAGHFRKRQWTYLTDIPQRHEDVSAQWLETLTAIADHSHVLLCQTPELSHHLASLVPAAQGKVRLLPPMIPMNGDSTIKPVQDHPLRLIYAGKFAPMWATREMLDVFAKLQRRYPDAELHVFGDKIHNPTDDPDFRTEIAGRLRDSAGVIWHRAVSRETLARRLPSMTIGWAWRSPALEAHTLELSTKILEYGCSRVPPLLYGNAINRRVFGDDYPLFAQSPDEAAEKIVAAFTQPILLESAREMAASAANGFTFQAVARDNLRPILSALEESA